MEPNQQAGGSSSSPAAQIQGGAFAELVRQQEQQLQMFWSFQRREMELAGDFKNHQLPLARIKKIMKADEDVRMISAEAPVLFAKACELFILELTVRAWLHAEDAKRRTLQRSDVAAAVTRTEIFDFLGDIVPREAAPPPPPAAAAERVPGYYSAAGMYMGQMTGLGWWGEEEEVGRGGGGGGGGGEEVGQAYGGAFGLPPSPLPPGS